jgi:glutathione S-transferase
VRRLETNIGESDVLPTITTFGWVPEFARGFVRDMRPRGAFEEVGQPYAVNLITDSKCPEHRRTRGQADPAGPRRAHARAPMGGGGDGPTSRHAAPAWARLMRDPRMREMPPAWNGPFAIFGSFTPILDTDNI